MNLILGWLGQLIGGPFLKAALDAYRIKQANLNNEDARTADLMARELAVEQRETEVNAQVIIAEEGRWYTALPRPAFAFAFVIVVWKFAVWDDCFGFGHHQPLDAEMAGVFKIVLTAYFGGRSLEKIANIVARRKR